MHVRTCVHAPEHSCVCVCVCVCMCASMYVCVCVYVCVHMCASICVYVCVCVYECPCTCVRKWIMQRCTCISMSMLVSVWPCVDNYMLIAIGKEDEGRERSGDEGRGMWGKWVRVGGCIDLYICTFSLSHVHKHSWTVSFRLWMHMSACAYAHTHTHTCTYTHTHTHTLPERLKSKHTENYLLFSIHALRFWRQQAALIS